jgi:hypothetical protein
LVLWLDTDSDETAIAIANRAELRPQGDMFLLDVPEDLLIGDVVFRWGIVGPRERPVTITGSSAMIGVSDIAAPVTITSTGGHVSVVETFGPTTIRASNGNAIWAGCQGPVRIDADHGISLKLTDRSFHDTLHATASQSIDLWLPPECVAGIEADVRSDDLLVCRADLAQVGRREKNDRVLFVYGGAPQFRLFSREGRVSINTYGDRRARCP